MIDKDKKDRGRPKRLRQSRPENFTKNSYQLPAFATYQRTRCTSEINSLNSLPD
jgi:hypothetical protein